jgi:hypothetical protein
MLNFHSTGIVFFSQPGNKEFKPIKNRQSQTALNQIWLKKCKHKCRAGNNATTVRGEPFMQSVHLRKSTVQSKGRE